MDLREATEEALLEGLASGESLVQICKSEKMPDARTVQRWMDKDPEFAAAVTRARETGFVLRADKAVEAAKTADDAQRGRLAFDAERWYLGKLSNAFSDKVKHIGGDKDDPAIKHAVDYTRMSDAELQQLASEG